jgi:hypothetical protein
MTLGQCCGRSNTHAPNKRSLFASFSSEKEVLTVFVLSFTRRVV